MIQIDTIPRETEATIIVVTGTVHPSIVRMEYGTDLSDMSSVPVNDLRFRVVLELQPGNNDYSFVGYSSTNEMVKTIRRNVVYNPPKEHLQNIQNTLDIHGERLGFRRMKGEMNPNYRTRLAQGSQVLDREDSVPKAVSTEIAFPYSHDFLRVFVTHTDFNHLILKDPYIRVTFDYIEVTDTSMYVNETVRFSSGYPFITPQEEVSDLYPMELHLESGEKLPRTVFDYDIEQNRVWLKDLTLVDSDLILKYHTVEKFSLSGTVQDTVNAINAFDGLGADFIPNTNHDGTTSADWIIKRSWRPLDTRMQFPADTGREQPGNRFGISEISTYALHDFRRDLVLANGIGGKLHRFVTELNKVDRRTWGTVVVGKDAFRDADFHILMDTFPHVMDSSRGGWGNDGLNIHEYIDLDQPLEFTGVEASSWRSGVGSEHDMEPSVIDYDQINSDTLFDQLKIPPNIIYGVL
jgi:hypothetical protein